MIPESSKWVNFIDHSTAITTMRIQPPPLTLASSRGTITTMPPPWSTRLRPAEKPFGRPKYPPEMDTVPASVPAAGTPAWPMLFFGRRLSNRMVVANANAWHYWRLVSQDPHDNEGLTNPAGTVAKRLYMLGNYSKFVRPGFHRIEATHIPQSGVLVSAYKDPSTGTLVVVAINQNTKEVSQRFSLWGTKASKATPWITSETSTWSSSPRSHSTAVPLLTACLLQASLPLLLEQLQDRARRRLTVAGSSRNRILRDQQL